MIVKVKEPVAPDFDRKEKAFFDRFRRILESVHLVQDNALSPQTLQECLRIIQ
jgi:hypothetical protein